MSIFKSRWQCWVLMGALFAGPSLAFAETSGGTSAGTSAGTPGGTSADSPACPPAGYTQASLLALKSDGFRLKDESRRDALALALLGCLAAPAPVLRDGVAFEALSTWLRAKQLSPATMKQLVDALLVRIDQFNRAASQRAAAAAAPPFDEFQTSFSLLVLSELARADRMAAYLDAPRRQHLLESAAAAVTHWRDYRGFDAQAGWRHGVAHGADLLMQLSLNPALTQEALRKLVRAELSQVAPPGEHFYIYGEGERLARAVLAASSRGLLAPAEWQALFDELVLSARPLASWKQAFESQLGLAKRHNTYQFLLFLKVLLELNLAPTSSALVQLVNASIKQLP